ncbi:dihydropyrimidinase [Tanacetum coccineum]
MKELRLDDKLNFVEEPVEIMDREGKQLKQSHVVLYLLADKLEGMNKARAIHLDDFVNTSLYVVHVMSTDVMEEITRAQRSGQRVIVEPVVSGLILDDFVL